MLEYTHVAAVVQIPQELRRLEGSRVPYGRPARQVTLPRRGGNDIFRIRCARKKLNFRIMHNVHVFSSM